jgi:hypothetical protein
MIICEQDLSSGEPTGSVVNGKEYTPADGLKTKFDGTVRTL